MKGKCYYCDKELTERTIKRHMKSCVVMKKRINEALQENKKTRNQYIISIKPKRGKSEFCLYISIDEALGLVHIDKLIRDVWTENDGRLSGFKINRKFYENKKMNTKLNEILEIGKKFEYEYDFKNTINLILEVVDEIEVSKESSQIEIIARNDEIKHICNKCEAEAKYFSYEKEEWSCEKCIDKEDKRLKELDYCNSQRYGGYQYFGKKDGEEVYLPGNNNKYKPLRKKAIKREDNDEFSDFNKEDNIESSCENFSEEVHELKEDIFLKDAYSFDINTLVRNLDKDNIYDIGKNLKINGIESLEKDQLADKFLHSYEKAIEDTLNLFDEERYKTLKKIVDNAGIQAIDNNEFDKHMNYFVSIGMLFKVKDNDGQDIALVPEILQNLIKNRNNPEYKKLIRINTEIIDVFRGMNRAYGIIKITDILNLFKRYGIEESEKINIKEIIQEAQYYYDEYDQEEKFIINSEVSMWRMMIKEIDQNLDYAAVSKEELLRTSKPDWIYTSKIGKEFIEDVRKVLNAEDGVLKEIVESLISEIQKRDFDEIIDDILGIDNSNNENVKEFVYVSVGKLLRNIRLWKYKGATINERVKSKIEAEKKTTVGRNEPCICGSGKKYKRCCGKNVG
ncbi:SEC-C metal-binding domain-containing protein [uncultured Clostridium sp.]|uniref:SEC-C metal-binding domain-containing protein n=1 Tax=uncultured Clostridium sp. TaxID=59620 RepID=UPI0028E5E3E5|nr:SEC-C metal-binding domain-containing protein [uncultured Clostridium sp.]